MRDSSTKHQLTAFVVDDEPGPLSVLAEDLRQQPEIKDVYTFSSYNDAIYPLIELQPDVVFLDIEVPGKSGLDFLKAIRPRISFSFHAVFYSGYSHYMLDAIRHSAFDFLLKPYKKEELRTIVERLVKAPANVITYADNIGRYSDATLHKLAIQTISELLLVTISEVLMIQYERDTRSWQLTLTDQSIHRLHAGVTATELLAMSHTLVRISSNCIVNMTYLAAIENATQRCRFSQPFEDIELYASRRYFSRLKERFELL